LRKRYGIFRLLVTDGAAGLFRFFSFEKKKVTFKSKKLKNLLKLFF